MTLEDFAKQHESGDRRCIGYANVEGKGELIVITSKKLEGTRFHPNIRKGLAALDACYAGMGTDNGASVLIGCFDFAQRFYPTHVGLTSTGESPAELYEVVKIIHASLPPGYRVAVKAVGDRAIGAPMNRYFNATNLPEQVGEIPVNKTYKKREKQDNIDIRRPQLPDHACDGKNKIGECYFHVQANVQELSSNTRYAIGHHLAHIHWCIEFMSQFGDDHVIGFGDVWKAVAADWRQRGLHEFTNYFEKEYVLGDNNNWRVGTLGPITPCTNVSLEAQNPVFGVFPSNVSKVRAAQIILDEIVTKLEQHVEANPPSRFPSKMSLDRRCIAVRLASVEWNSHVITKVINGKTRHFCRAVQSTGRPVCTEYDLQVRDTVPTMTNPSFTDLTHYASVIEFDPTGVECSCRDSQAFGDCVEKFAACIRNGSLQLMDTETAEGAPVGKPRKNIKKAVSRRPQGGSPVFCVPCNMMWSNMHVKNITQHRDGKKCLKKTERLLDKILLDDVPQTVIYGQFKMHPMSRVPKGARVFALDTDQNVTQGITISDLSGVDLDKTVVIREQCDYDVHVAHIWVVISVGETDLDGQASPIDENETDTDEDADADNDDGIEQHEPSDDDASGIDTEEPEFDGLVQCNALQHICLLVFFPFLFLITTIVLLISCCVSNRSGCSVRRVSVFRW